MDRRALLTAIGGVFAVTAARAQTAADPLGGLLSIPGQAVGAGVGVLDGGAGLLGGGLGGGFGGTDDPYALRDLMGGAFAIATSQLALQRSRNPAIREFAQLEINEQTSVASALGTTVGTVPPRPDQQAIIARLASMRPGPRFDHAYVLGQLAGHRELLANNTQAVSSDPEPTVRRVASLSIATIQTHIAILERLRHGLAAV